MTDAQTHMYVESLNGTQSKALGLFEGYHQNYMDLTKKIRTDPDHIQYL